MLSEQQRIDDTAETGARREARTFRLRREMPRLRSSQMKLPLQIASSNSTYRIGISGLTCPSSMPTIRPGLLVNAAASGGIYSPTVPIT